MSTVRIDRPAPDFSLKTFGGELVELSQFQQHKNVLLVFNRGFT
jgi:peroxiredoxin